MSLLDMVSRCERRLRDFRQVLLAALTLGFTTITVMAEDAPVQTLSAADIQVLASDLKMLEGPTVLSNGNVAFVAAPDAVLSVSPTGQVATLASPGVGVAGSALGANQVLYIAKMDSGIFQKRANPQDKPTLVGDAAIVAIDLKTKATRTLYRAWDSHPLTGPNDLVVDKWGDLWFTDIIEGSVYWARSDGSAIRRVVYPLPAANGIALSPDGHSLYLASESKLVAFQIAARGELTMTDGAPQRKVIATLDPKWRPDGIKTEANGNIVLACWDEGLISISPLGAVVSHVKLPDLGVSNLVFGGRDMRTIYLTTDLADRSSGKVVAIKWPRAGLKAAW